VNILKDRLLKESECSSGRKKFPVVMYPKENQSFERILGEIADRKIELMASLHKNGSILFRNCKIKNYYSFGRILKALNIPPCNDGEYYGEVLRDYLKSEKGVMDVTFSPSPDSSVIPPHTEAYYWYKQPKYISFYCEETNCRYGETPLFNCVDIMEDIPDQLLNRLKNIKAVMEYRLSSDPLINESDTSARQMKNTWQRSFATTDKSQVERELDRDDVEYHWEENGRLLMKVYVKLVSRHPDTGELCFRGVRYPFNNNKKFMMKNYILPRLGLRKYLKFLIRDLHLNVMVKFNLIDSRDLFWVDSLDGVNLSKKENVILTNSYFKNVSIFKWQTDDMLIVDNIKLAHARLNVDSLRKIKIFISQYVDNKKIEF